MTAPPLELARCPLCGRLTNVLAPDHKNCRCDWRLCVADAHAPTAVMFAPGNPLWWRRVDRPDRDPDGPPPPPTRRTR